MPSLDRQFDELRHLKGHPEFNLEGGYSVVPAVHPSWKDAKRRILFVLESLDSKDIRGGRLFSSALSNSRNPEELNLMIGTVRNTLTQSWHLYQEYLGRNSLTDYPANPDFAIGFVNFNATRYFDTKGSQRTKILHRCAERTIKWVEELEPTDVIVFGDSAATYLLTEYEHNRLIPYQRGWVYRTKIGSHKCRVTTTLDLEPLYNYGGTDLDDDDSFNDSSGAADLLYFVCRNLCNAYAGKILHSLKGIDEVCRKNVVFVDTLDKFNEFIAKLYVHDGDLGYDIESLNLEAYRNKFFTQQYCLDGVTSYVIPLDHPHTCFDAEELAYMHKKLRRFWARRPPDGKPLCLIVGANVQFDLKVTRALYSIPVIYHPAWDVTAGESLLDENVGLFDRFKFWVGDSQVKTTMGNLRNLLTHYGNNAYHTIDFTKEQRGEFGRTKICEDTKEAHDAVFYAAFDALSVWHIKRAQIERAAYIRIAKERTYERVYTRHVSKQMSKTVHAVSTMHQHGSHLDKDYLAFLMSKASPLYTVKQAMEVAMRKSPNAAKANAILLQEQGLQATGLFGQSQWMFEIGKPAHRLTLFYKVMDLKPISHTETGQPQVDKKFFAAYKEHHPEADVVYQWNTASKLLGTYVKSWSIKMYGRLDSALDMCLRPSFGFFGIVTGRLNSFDPSLQQVPNHGPSAKYIKRMFVPKKGYLSLAYDYSANEVRFWGIIAKDASLAGAFKYGQQLRQQWIKTPTAELKAEIKTKGDIHIQSVHRFFSIWVEKSDPLREAIKKIVFGLTPQAE